MRPAPPAERTAPHNLDAERAVLGVLLVANDRILEVADLLAPDDFFRAAHATVYQALLALAARGVRADLVTLKDALATAGTLEDVGGPAYLASLTDGTPRSTNLAHYAAVVRAHATRRRLIAYAGRVLAAAHDEEQPEAALEMASAALSEIQMGRRDGHLRHVDAAVVAARDLIDQVRATGRPVTGHSSGLADLDVYTRGMHPGQLVIVAARPGMGKSALGLNIARHVGRTHAVAFFSLEMSEEELAARLIFAEAQVNGHQILSGHVSDVSVERMAAGIEALLQPPGIYVDDTPHRSVEQVRWQTRRLMARAPVGLVVVDYLQLMAPARRRADDNRALELADMTRGLKVFAKEVRLPVLLVSQLNRNIEHRKGQRPQLSDLAESGAIEKDADQVWFVHPDEDKHTAEIIVAKNRGGPRGVPTVAYFVEQTRFANLAREEE